MPFMLGDFIYIYIYIYIYILPAFFLFKRTTGWKKNEKIHLTEKAVENDVDIITNCI